MVDVVSTTVMMNQLRLYIILCITRMSKSELEYINIHYKPRVNSSLYHFLEPTIPLS